MLKRYDSAARLAALMVCCALVAATAGNRAFAQTTNGCAEALEIAERHYVEGRFDDVIATLATCLERDDVLLTEVVAAYRLTALAQIRRGEVEEARLSVIELLSRDPEYEADPIRDIPSYVALVRLAKQELQLNAEPPLAGEETMPENEAPPSRSWFRSNRGWLIGGGSVALIGIVTAVAVSSGGGGGGGDSSALPGPPSLPD